MLFVVLIGSVVAERRSDAIAWGQAVRHGAGVTSVACKYLQRRKKGGPTIAQDPEAWTLSITLEPRAINLGAMPTVAGGFL